MPRKKVADGDGAAETPTASGLTVRAVAVADLHCDPANARTHDERNLRVITDSLKEFGQVEPLVVQRGTGKVIGGNGRLEAMRALGWATCEVTEVDVDDLKAARLGLTLNRSSELAAWDFEALSTLLKAIDSEGSPVDDLGWEPFELEPLLKAEWAPPGDDAAPAAPDEFPAYDESIPTEHRCPKCGYAWSGKTSVSSTVGDGVGGE